MQSGWLSELKIEAIATNFKEKISRIDRRSQEILADLKKQIGDAIKDLN